MNDVSPIAIAAALDCNMAVHEAIHTVGRIAFGVWEGRKPDPAIQGAFVCDKVGMLIPDRHGMDYTTVSMPVHVDMLAAYFGTERDSCISAKDRDATKRLAADARSSLINYTTNVALLCYLNGWGHQLAGHIDDHVGLMRIDAAALHAELKPILKDAIRITRMHPAVQSELIKRLPRYTITTRFIACQVSADHYAECAKLADAGRVPNPDHTWQWVTDQKERAA